MAERCGSPSPSRATSERRPLAATGHPGGCITSHAASAELAVDGAATLPVFELQRPQPMAYPLIDGGKNLRHARLHRSTQSCARAGFAAAEPTASAGGGRRASWASVASPWARVAEVRCEFICMCWEGSGKHAPLAELNIIS